MAKISNGVISKVAVYVAGILFTAGCVYGVVHYRLNTVEGDVKYIKENNVPNINQNKMELVGVKKDIEHLGEKVDRNFKDQQEFQVEQRIMQKEIIKEIKELHK